MFSLDPESSTPLVLQIVEGFRRVVEDGSLRVGSKAPSIRQFAHAHEISVFTVVDAYDRLVAQGYFASRQNSGFFVKPRPVSDAGAPGIEPVLLRAALDSSDAALAVTDGEDRLISANRLWGEWFGGGAARVELEASLATAAQSMPPRR